MEKFLIALILISTSMVAQSPWVKKKGEAYSQLSFNTINNYSKLFGQPDYFTERVLSDNSLQVFGEYGISNKITLLGVIPVKLLKSDNLVVAAPKPVTTAADKTFLGNIMLGIKHNFHNKKWLVSGQLNVEANTSTFDATSGLRSGYNAWSFTPLVLAGRAFNKWFLQAFTGVDFKTNQYSSSYKLGGEVGYKPVPWLWAIVFFDGLYSLKNGNVVIPLSNALTGLYTNNQSYSAYGFKVIGEFTSKNGILFSYGSAFSAENVAKKSAMGFGYYQKF